MKRYRIKGSLVSITASCLHQAYLKLVATQEELKSWQVHFYTKSKRKAWAEFQTSYGYDGIIEEV